MIFSTPLNTRATECGPDRWITLPAVISYMEHCRWLWMREPALGLLQAVHEGHGFYVVNQSIAMHRRFGMGQQGYVRCALTKAGRSAAEGVQDVLRKDGVQLAHCWIRGAWVGPTGRLARIPAKARESLFEGNLDGVRGEPEAGSDMSLFDPPQPMRPGTLDLTHPEHRPDGIHHHPIVVRASDIDIFDHVNAANYVRYVASALATQGISPSIHKAELQYSGQAVLGDELDVVSWSLGDHRHAAHILRGEELLFRTVVETEPS
jgi:acyl-CoA thioesterase FadM